MKKLQQVLFAILLACASAASAQVYPAKAVRFIVPYPAGGYYDLLARVIGAKLAEAWRQPFVVENRVGANGMIGTDYVAKAAPDGYTILMGGIGPLGVNPSLYAKLPYNVARDFAPIIHVASAPNVLVVHPSVPVRSVKELIAYAKSNPGKLAFSSAGRGSSQHLSGEMLKTIENIDITHVPYKGSAPGVRAVLAGEVGMMFGTMADVVGHARGGKLRALAVTSAKRIPALPEVPTMIEAGVPGFEATAWFGIVGPAGLQREVVAKLNGEVGRILRMPDVLARISQQGSAEIVGGSPEQYGDFIRAEGRKWADVAMKAGVKPE
ncbi:MAG: LacI family transcriptional regulator [Betaproteobacteria bacterium RIFCSPLOWO2_02_FULL_63_19]|nr:MAG: LacI family transcriptional regulator [Betaproteobacteria bacterium RIFCSPLOWO2_02_FULL_63_19]